MNPTTSAQHLAELQATNTVTFPNYLTYALFTCNPSSFNERYLGYGLLSEIGEVYGKLKKAIRDGETPELKEALKAELGDVVWYCALRLKLAYMDTDVPVGTWTNFKAVRTLTLDVSLNSGILNNQVDAVRAAAFLLPEVGQQQLPKLAVLHALTTILHSVDMMAQGLGSSLEEVAKLNSIKLLDRHARSVIGGSGDNR